jgi:hypothetical protein
MVLANPLLVLAVVFPALVAAGELGFRVGRWLASRCDEKTRLLEDSVQTASLGLLALLLGFSFSLVAGRFDSRRDVLIREANAIGTAYHNADLLPEQYGSEMREVFRRYVAVRIRAYKLGSRDAADAAARSKELQDALWKPAMSAARDERVPPFFVTEVARSLNVVNDSAEDALSAFENKMPGSVMKLLFAIAFIATWIAGYCDGVRVRRLFLVLVVQPLLITLVIAVIADMDQPFGGWLRVSTNPLVRVEEGMR